MKQTGEADRLLCELLFGLNRTDDKCINYTPGGRKYEPRNSIQFNII